jgi:hypothetical protein
MYARVARWEGAEGEALQAMAKDINADAASGPPDGVPANGVLFLIDPEKGQALGITLFDTEDDLRQGDETLNSMNPPADAGQRASVEMYEVGVDMRL